jgi:hypothetical protein
VQNAFKEARDRAAIEIAAQVFEEAGDCPPPPKPAGGSQTLDYVQYQVDTWNRIGIVWLVGISSGVFGGLFATGGPPLIFFTAWARLDRMETRGTMALAFLAENAGRWLYFVFFQSEYDLWSHDFLIIFTVLSLSSVLSLIMGNFFADFIDQASFRLMLLVLLAVSAGFVMTVGCSTQLSLYIAVACSIATAVTIWMAYRCALSTYSVLVVTMNVAYSLKHMSFYPRWPCRIYRDLVDDARLAATKQENDDAFTIELAEGIIGDRTASAVSTGRQSSTSGKYERLPVAEDDEE